MWTQYRISSRWALPSPLPSVLDGVKRVLKYFASRPHHTIVFTPEARELLLGMQLAQSLDACRAAGQSDSAGEAQHSAASGQIGVWAALVCILRWAAEVHAPEDVMKIIPEDVELSMRVLLLVYLAAGHPFV